MIYAKYIELPTHPKTLGIHMDLKWQEEDAMWHRKSSLCGSHILHVYSWSIATLIFPCIYLFISFIKYLFHSNVQTSFIFPLIPNPKASTPKPRKLVIFLQCNYLTLSINLKKSHKYGKCDYAIVTQCKIWEMKILRFPLAQMIMF